MNPVCEQIADQRRAARRAVNIHAELVTSRWDRPSAARCTDLSPYGMWLETPLPLVEGDEVVVTFRPPRADAELTLFGRVRRIHRHAAGSTIGVGLELEGLDYDEQGLLARSLRGIPPRFPSWPPLAES
jgi:PilZ domain-containing protein